MAFAAAAFRAAAPAATAARVAPAAAAGGAAAAKAAQAAAAMRVCSLFACLGIWIALGLERCWVLLFFFCLLTKEKKKKIQKAVSFKYIASLCLSLLRRLSLSNYLSLQACLSLAYIS